MEQLTQQLRFLAEQYIIGRIDGLTFQNHVADLFSALQLEYSSALAEWIIRNSREQYDR